MPNNNTEVLIVGAGAAGIAAARTLSDAGVDCLLVEARERLGGRAFTDHVDGCALDLGCGWLHSADRNPWAPIAEAQGRVIDKTTPPWMRPAEQPGFPLAQQRDYREVSQAFFEQVDAAGRKTPDVAVSDLLVPGGRWNGLLSAVTTYITGGDPDQVSARDFERYRDSEVNWRVADGYGTVIAAHAHGVPLSLGNPVQRIDHAGTRVRVETAKGTIEAAQVVIALPSAVIAQSEDLFVPALPQKIDAALGLPLGLADKLFLELDRADEFKPDSRLFGATDRIATATYHVRPFGRPLIECYFGGRNAHSLEQGGERAFFDFAVEQLVALFGSGFAKRVKFAAMHLWAADPFARGSYSYAVPGRAGDRARLAAPVDGRLFFAGEACSLDYFSTAHGGYLTGVAAADAILSMRR
jgi:monoamine oxidase